MSHLSYQLLNYQYLLLTAVLELINTKRDKFFLQIFGLFIVGVISYGMLLITLITRTIGAIRSSPILLLLFFAMKKYILVNVHLT